MTVETMEWTASELWQAVEQALPAPRPSGIHALNQGALAFYWQGKEFRVTSQRLSTVCSVHCDRLDADPGEPDLASMLIGMAVHAWLVGERVLAKDPVGVPIEESPVEEASGAIERFMDALDRAMGVTGPGPGPGPTSASIPGVHAGKPTVHVGITTDTPAFVVVLEDEEGIELMNTIGDLIPGATAQRVV